jgi:predicted membrane protein
MQANGIQKKMIAFMMLPFVVLPTIVGTILGYIFGLFLQIPTLSLLSNY